jgi:hypothetical protein
LVETLVFSALVDLCVSSANFTWAVMEASSMRSETVHASAGGSGPSHRT